MNIELLNNLQKKLESLELTIDGINKKINALSIDSQYFIKKNEIIKPSIGYKIAYDSNGLITKGENLDESDIPVLSINKIRGLQRELNKKIDKSEIDKLLSNKTSELLKRDIVSTGCKVNIDDNGCVVSISDLLPEDIPNLSINQITGLYDELKYIKELISNINRDKEENKNIDNKENIIINQNKKLSENDIPISIINRLNKLEAKLINFASKQSVDNLTKLIDGIKDNSNNDKNTIIPITRKENNNETIDVNRIKQLELSMQKILNQFSKISEVIKINKKLESIENRLLNLENKK